MMVCSDPNATQSLTDLSQLKSNNEVNGRSHDVVDLDYRRNIFEETLEEKFQEEEQNEIEDVYLDDIDATDFNDIESNDEATDDEDSCDCDWTDVESGYMESTDAESDYTGSTREELTNAELAGAKAKEETSTQMEGESSHEQEDDIEIVEEEEVEVAITTDPLEEATIESIDMKSFENPKKMTRVSDVLTLNVDFDPRKDNIETTFCVDGVKSWNPQWYESCVDFEQRQCTRKSHNTVDEKELFKRAIVVEDNQEELYENVLMPPAILKQMDVVKNQMFEYNQILERFEEGLERKVYLKKRIQCLKDSKVENETKLTEQISQQSERIKVLAKKHTQYKQQVEKMAKKVSIYKRNYELRSKAVERDLQELAELRQLYGNKIDKKFLTEASELSADKLNSGSNIIQGFTNALRGMPTSPDDMASISTTSFDSINRDGKVNLLSFIIRNLQHEDEFSYTDNSSIGSSRIGSRSSSSSSKKRNKKGFFNTMFSTLQDDSDKPIPTMVVAK